MGGVPEINRRSQGRYGDALRISNGNGGVFFGVLADGRIVGQTISDATIRDVTAELIKLDPPATILSERIPVADSRDGPATVSFQRILRQRIIFAGSSFRRSGAGSIVWVAFFASIAVKALRTIPIFPEIPHFILAICAPHDQPPFFALADG